VGVELFRVSVSLPGVDEDAVHVGLTDLVEMVLDRTGEGVPEADMDSNNVSDMLRCGVSEIDLDKERVIEDEVLTQLVLSTVLLTVRVVDSLLVMNSVPDDDCDPMIDGDVEIETVPVLLRASNDGDALEVKLNASVAEEDNVRNRVGVSVSVHDAECLVKRRVRESSWVCDFVRDVDTLIVG